MRKPLKCQQVHDSILRDLENGAFLPGERLPSERKLSARYHAAHVTIGKAVEILVAAGRLRRMLPFGVFVAGASSSASSAPRKIRSCILAGSPLESGLSEISFAILSGIISGATACGIETALVPLDRLEETLLRRPATGGVIFWSVPERLEAWMLNCVSRFEDTRFVITNTLLPNDIAHFDNFCRVCNDDALGGALAARHLHAAGHREFGVILLNQRWRNFAARAEGFRAELERLGVPNRSIHQHYLSLDGSTTEGIDQACEAARAILRRHPSCTAFFTVNDFLGVGIQRAIRKGAGASTAALVAYDHVIPSLATMNHFATISIDFEGIGRRAVRTLMEPSPPELFLVPPSFVPEPPSAGGGRP